ncbi:hypothetical protein FHR24_002776 [Wenyingzhuangia heitensis]|uniref:Uncharacterized protein n=1 Tax=Wenyingzhuangia heitensis TaxID=1487859 RepID=A0ABX0UGZ6_9FLAO|nr:hypothetical protein [Wenyingzhuangia heitensis]NIJ46292.1 hypothetical protein [Wenyingzhuangia heitensis]
MKNLIWILVIMVGSSMVAQTKNNLQGPEAKNYKPWQHKTESTTVVSTSNKQKLTGPAYKNYKPWQDNNPQKSYAIVTDNRRNKLKGPAYKNYKPWQK